MSFRSFWRRIRGRMVDVDWQRTLQNYQDAGPRAICRAVRRRLRYTEWPPYGQSDAASAWRYREGNCLDYANCVCHLAINAGIAARLLIYWLHGGVHHESKGHAIALCGPTGALWLSDNGEYHKVADEDEALQLMAHRLRCRPEDLDVREERG